MKKFYLFNLLFCFGLADIQAQNPWLLRNSGTQKNLHQIRAVSNEALVIPGDSGVFLRWNTSDPLWSMVQLPTQKPIVSVENILFQSDGSKTLLLTDDGKVFHVQLPDFSWNSDSLPENATPGSKTRKLVHLNIGGNNEIRYGILCDSGKIVACKKPWPDPRFDIQLSTQKQVNDLFPFNTWNLLAVGDSGKIWKAAGLDDPFLPINHGLTTESLNRVFLQGSRLWVVGNNGTLLSSSNQGNTWTSVETGTQAHLYGGCAIDSVLWLAGANGTLLSSPTQGQNWIQHQTGSTQTLRDIRKINNSLYAVGDKGTILENQLLTRNLGSRNNLALQKSGSRLYLWSAQESPTRFRVTDLAGKTLVDTDLDPRTVLSWQAGASGIYLIQSQVAGAPVESRKIFLEL